MILALFLASCGPAQAPLAIEGPWATKLVVFDPGEGSGFGADRLPGIVLGPPKGQGTRAGSLDVLSLGKGGEVVLGFDRPIVDGEGPDLLVFENVFYADGDPSQPFSELGEVAVSTDAKSWHTFGCDRAQPASGRCAGLRPVEPFPPETIDLDPAKTGGDPFDLADLAIDQARYVRVRDLDGFGEAPIAGFDLDAIGAVHSD